MGRSALFLFAISCLQAQTGDNILVVVNRRDADSRQIADYYRQKRGLSSTHSCSLDVTSDETIDWNTYTGQIEKPVADCLKKAQLVEKVLYIVTTMGMPLRIDGSGGDLRTSEHSSVDSDLALLYGKLKGFEFHRAGAMSNPFYGKRDVVFQHPLFPIYLVTRLAAWDLADAKAMVDRSLAARNRGEFVIDLSSPAGEGNNWLRAAALLLPKDRVVLEETTNVLYGQRDVIGYASWGSNDGNRKRRWPGFQWLPGAIATEFVSTNARTLKRPPDNWNITTYEDRDHWFVGSPQSLSADYIHEGATGVSGNVFEPFLVGCVRPELLFPAYAQGRTLAESYYMALPFLSWQGVILGDPLCSLKKP